MIAHRKSTRAFTLVELLVVIAIIGVLVALLLPAIQAAREAARRAQCSNNLRQLGLALQNYHDTHNRFPGACHRDPWSGGNHRTGSVLVKLLPYVEQAAIYDQIDFNEDVTQWFFDNHRHTWIPAFVCPSDPRGSVHADRAQSNYGISLGAQRMSSQGGWCTMYEGHVRGPSGHGSTNDGSQISGLFSRFFWAANLAEIIDGTSNTIAMGEIRPMCGDHHEQGWFHGNSLWTATTAPINFPTCRGEQQYQANSCYAHNNWQTSQGFKSRHPGGAQFVFADGTVHFLTETIDYQTYQYLGARASGQVVGSF